MKNKIIAICKFNSGEAYVLKSRPKLTYQKRGRSIIGTDGIFVSGSYYERPIKPIDPNWSGWQAFGGCKFEIKLEDGNTEKCSGQWWGGIRYEANEILNNIEIVNVVYSCVEDLKKCFVFGGNYAIEQNIKKLRTEYKGKIFGYKEYQLYLEG